MSICTNSGEIACGNAGCRERSLCCQAEIGFGCDAGYTCYTDSATVGCWTSGTPAPSGPVPCFNYAARPSLSLICGTADWCLLCTQTEYPYCTTDVVIGFSGQMPLTAISCDSSSGISTTVLTPHSTLMPTSTRRTTGTPSITGTPGITGIINPFITSPTSTPSSTPHKIAPGVAAGIGIGAFLAIAIIALLAFFLWRKNHASPAAPAPPPVPSAVYPTYPQPGANAGAGQYVYGQGQGQGGPEQGGMYPPPHQQGEHQYMVQQDHGGITKPPMPPQVKPPMYEVEG